MSVDNVECPLTDQRAVKQGWGGRFFCTVKPSYGTNARVHPKIIKNSHPESLLSTKLKSLSRPRGSEIVNREIITRT
ncbi:hypothetical protein GWI33_019797 [Rhynchophorus ferrugineus]|uniref:Uncharacterized protein n=1 Tax=Rhynchophorus ferrugineus TaxID=354439 RepID=A0A834HSV3_RHYFE|nr:hypothetical protein GWI33_019797 [Rhynchophorus ferrugineus]